jgi:hypothetical protein
MDRKNDRFKNKLMCEEGPFKGYFTYLGPNYRLRLKGSICRLIQYQKSRCVERNKVAVKF